MQVFSILFLEIKFFIVISFLFLALYKIEAFFEIMAIKRKNMLREIFWFAKMKRSVIGVKILFNELTK